MGGRRKLRAGAPQRVRVSLCALVFALSIGATPGYADDVSGEYENDISDEVVGDVSEEIADDVSEEIDDSASEEYADNGDEDAAEDSGPGRGRVVWDAALLRPLNFIRLVAGCALMVPVSVLALPGGIDNIENMADYFVGQPYWDIFDRPLGKF